jgi:hypothetical protein
VSGTDARSAKAEQQSRRRRPGDAEAPRHRRENTARKVNIYDRTDMSSRRCARRRIGYTEDDGSGRFAGIPFMEPTGIEPVTSCLQNSRSRSDFSAKKSPFAGSFEASRRSELRADACGLSAFVVDSGTFDDKCLNAHLLVAHGLGDWRAGQGRRRGRVASRGFGSACGARVLGGCR